MCCPCTLMRRPAAASVRVQDNSGNSSALNAIQWLIIGWALLCGCLAAPSCSRATVGLLPLNLPAWLLHRRVGQEARLNPTLARPGC